MILNPKHQLAGTTLTRPLSFLRSPNAEPHIPCSSVSQPEIANSFC
jgi:hypothetical protein